MRRAMRPIVIGLATVTFFATTATSAYAAVAPAASARSRSRRGLQRG